MSVDLKLETSWTYKVTVLADRISKHASRVASDVGGINLSQWRVLAAIGDQNGRTASQVVDLTPMDKGIVSRAVASLVSKGLLEREASDRDGRSSHLYMTADGRGVYEQIVRTLNQTGPDQTPILTQTTEEALLETLNSLIDSYGSIKP